MAQTIEISEQYLGKYGAPLDAKLTPVATKEDLKNIKRANRYVGMTVFVLDEACDYWLYGGTANGNWVKKTSQGVIEITGDDVTNE